MGLIRISDDAEQTIKDMAKRAGESITKVVDRLLAGGPVSNCMEKISDMDMLAILSNDIKTIPIPTPTAIEILNDEKNEHLFVDKGVYNMVDDPEGARFVLSRGCICVRNYTYPTTDYQVMRLTEEIIKLFEERGVL